SFLFFFHDNFQRAVKPVANQSRKNGPAASTLCMRLLHSLIRNPGIKISHIFRPYSSNQTSLLKNPLVLYKFGTNSWLVELYLKRGLNFKFWNFILNLIRFPLFLP
ncbi:hypothetical protein AABB24_012519, partial [Solanum stoloniferum]